MIVETFGQQVSTALLDQNDVISYHRAAVT